MTKRRVPKFAPGDILRPKHGSYTVEVRTVSVMSNNQVSMNLVRDDGALLAQGEEDYVLVTAAADRQIELTPAAAALATLLAPIDRESVPAIRERRKAALDNLTKLAELRAALELAIATNVAQAREANASYYDYGAPTWETIGKALGVTKQSAQAKYGGK